MPRLVAHAPVSLSHEQTAAVEQLLAFEQEEQTLGGFAGTGKTTVIKTLAAELPGFAFAAYTGKAANVLRRKGVPASTIHSLIYKPEQVERRDPKTGRKYTAVEFHLKPADEIDCTGFVIDEASMVDETIYRDLQSFGRPLIFVGDHGQLPPVNGKFNIMERPDITLETVHRNAGEIAQFANFIRQGNLPVLWGRHPDCTGKQVRVMKWAELEYEDFCEIVDAGDKGQMICARNDTRISRNQLVRECFDLPADHPVVGDRIMCLQNNHRLGVYNGMQGEIADIDVAAETLVFRSDGRDYQTAYVPEQFNHDKLPHHFKGRLPFDYSYCVTCHKAQGDEWDHVMVFEQRCWGWEFARWAYTAASRARRQLTWVS